ncbi:MAG: MobV family relaxase [Desulfovermiculus sp.]
MYGIMRFEKLKTKGELAGAAAHVGRKRPTPNADPTRAKNNQTLHGSPDPVQAVEDRYQATGATRRKNGVLVYEFIISASPEFFREKNEYGHHEAELTQALGMRTVSWLKEEFGEDNVLSVTMHLDEATPHIHAYVTPLKVNKKGKWAQAAKQWTGTIPLCSEMQSRFAAAVSDLGLKRGTRGSKAKHTKVKHFYAAINETSVKRLPSFRVDPPSALRVMTRAKREEYAKRETKRLRKQILPVVREIRNQAKSAALSRKKELEYKRTAESLQGKVDFYQQRAAMLEDIQMVDVLKALGYHDEVYDELGTWGNMSSIDLTQHLLKCSATEAMSFLAHIFGAERAQKAVVFRTSQNSKHIVENAMRHYPFVEELEPEPIEEPELESVQTEEPDEETGPIFGPR